MPHQDFELAARKAKSEPITFGFMGEVFTCVSEPSLGDSLDVIRAPEVDATSEPSVAMGVSIMAEFVRKMLVDDDKPRWDAVLYKVPRTEGMMVVNIGTWIIEQLSGFPTSPPAGSFSGGRPLAGVSSNRPTAGSEA